MNKPIFLTLLMLTVLMPVFFLPFNTDAVYFPKTILFIGLTLLALLFWLINILKTRTIQIQRTGLDFPILGLIAIYIISSFFSVDKYASFTQTVLIIFLAIFYFLLVQIINKKRKKILLHGFVYSCLISGLLFVAGAIHELPIQIPNLLGTQSGLIVILALLAPIIYKWRWFMILPVIIILAIIYLINFKIGWIVLGAATLAYLGFSILKHKKNARLQAIPLAILLICIVSLIVGLPRLINLNLPAEISLSRQASWDIAWQNSKDNVKNALIGSGPATFNYAFSKYRPEQFNQNLFWSVRFQKAHNFWLNNLASIGLLGVLAWLSIFIFNFIKIKNYNLIITLLAASIFTNFSAVILFVMFLFFAFSVKTKNAKIKEIKTNGIGLGFILFLAGLIVFGAFAGKIYAADYYFKQGNILKAIQLNKHNPTYYLALANQAILDLQNPENSEKAEILMSQAVNSIQKVTELSPNNAGFWQARGQLFDQLQQKDIAIKAYERAIELEPTNPILYQELGRFKQEPALLEKAISLRPGLPVAQYELGRIYYNQGDIEKAEQRFIAAVLISPNYSNALYSLALIYEKKDKKDVALKLFERVLELNPNSQEVKQKIFNLQ